MSHSMLRLVVVVLLAVVLCEGRGVAPRRAPQAGSAPSRTPKTKPPNAGGARTAQLGGSGSQPKISRAEMIKMISKMFVLTHDEAVQRAAPMSDKDLMLTIRQASAYAQEQQRMQHQMAQAVAVMAKAANDSAHNPCGTLIDQCYTASKPSVSGLFQGIFGYPIVFVNKTIFGGKWLKFDTRPYNANATDDVWFGEIAALPIELNSTVPSVLRFDPPPNGEQLFMAYQRAQNASTPKMHAAQEKFSKNEITKAQAEAIFMNEQTLVMNTLLDYLNAFTVTPYKYVHPDYQMDRQKPAKVVKSLTPLLNTMRTVSRPAVVEVPNVQLHIMNYLNKGSSNVFENVRSFFTSLNRKMGPFYMANYDMRVNPRNEIFVCKDKNNPHCI